MIIRDSGLVHSLLGLESLDDVLGHPVVGGSWEGFVIENLISSAPNGTQSFFYRSAAGAEIDLLLELPGGERWAIDVKRSSNPNVGKGFHIAADDVAATGRWVVHGGSGTFPLGGGITATTVDSLAATLARLRR